jgi:hypothetical protein
VPFQRRSESHSREDFREQTGKHMGTGRPLLPPMFVEGLQALPDSDLKAIYAYLRSIPPIKNVVPQPVAPPDVK